MHATTVVRNPLVALVAEHPTATTRSAVAPSSRPGTGFSEVREAARRRLLAASALVVGLAAVTASALAVIVLGVAA
ncbi:hypothetical protein [Curtobacterium sp. MCBD17_008]|uniref:hypothetical protein n=1 Tax=Curtobacterium sp. MCBD17_008 TaxID=2175656 RepID=UPI000DA6FB26|nr:hypothetical protein [Curtobacterium sp. MCBD17_008]PZE88661.1 hypothetical protein DEI95_14965 [Curtobacterium sp. MCBD17_008]